MTMIVAQANGAVNPGERTVEPAGDPAHLSAMPASTTLNARNLEKLGAAALADLLIEVSTGHAAIKRRLRLALADVAGPDEMAAQIRKRLASVAKARSTLDWRQRRALAADLATQLAAIVGPLATADPRTAHDLLWHFLTLADRLDDRTDVDDAQLHDLFAGAVAGLGPLATAARIAPDAVVERLFDVLTGPDHAHLAGLIDSVAGPLGVDGLHDLKTRILAWHDGAGSDTGLAAGRAALRRTETARRILERIADAVGDVDGWIAHQPAPARRRPVVAIEIARRLHGAGRAVEALAAIDAADTDRLSYLPPEWDSLRLAILETLGRMADAQAWRWQRFEQTLHAQHLRDHLRRLPDFDDFEAEQRALAHVEAYADIHAALAFLVEWPAPDRAARMVLARRAEIDGNAYEILTEAADRLDPAFPLAATLLRRAMIDFALRGARTSRYGHAARHLIDCAAADVRIVDHGPLPDHATYVAALRDAYHRRIGFWQAAEG